MEKIVLKTKRPWNWKVFLVLVGLIIPAVFAIVPFTFYQLNAYNETGTNALKWQALMGDALITGMITIAFKIAPDIIRGPLGIDEHDGAPGIDLLQQAD